VSYTTQFKKMKLMSATTKIITDINIYDVEQYKNLIIV